jgi:hypothetical protein
MSLAAVSFKTFTGFVVTLLAEWLTPEISPTNAIIKAIGKSIPMIFPLNQTVFNNKKIYVAVLLPT